MDLSKLIEKQIAMWGIRDRLANALEPPRRCVEGGVAYGPCLLVSRECGSGGTLIARRAGERLGWNVYDGEIVDEIAQIAHERQRLIQSVDEHVRSYWEQTWLQILAAGEMTGEKYLYYLRQVVMSLGHHGEVVIVGRGAHHLLPAESALRVRVVAPMELRAKRVAQQEALSLEQARAKAQAVDAERAAFLRKVFRSDANSHLNYDLVINTSEISYEKATEIVLSALREKLGCGERSAPIRPTQLIAHLNAVGQP